MTPFILLTSVSKTYGSGGRQVKALRNVSLELGAGEIGAVAGPSGSGKTTLLTLLGALDRSTSGRICVGDADLATLDARAAARFRQINVGFIFQAYNLVPVLTAAENIGLPLGIRRIAGAARRRRVEALLEELGLRAMARRRPAELSGGQQQRVAIARALVAEPKLVLADEPTAHLDAETARDVMALLRRVNAVRRTTFMFSTHDPFVEAAADVRFRLRSGGLVRDLTGESGGARCRNFCASHCATYCDTRVVR